MYYHIPEHQQRFESEQKRSRFITTIDCVKNRNEAKTLLARLRQEFPDANHHCWAYILNSPEASHGQDQSDDGEPKGTAGKPMLNVLQHSGLGQVMAVVTRYFGGIKLGAGGLVRAYSSAVSEAIKELNTIEYLVKEEIFITLPYALLDTLKHRILDTRIRIIAEQYSDQINLTLQCPVPDLQKCREILDRIGQGRISYHFKSDNV